MNKYPWEHDDEEKPRQTCQVQPPPWYENSTMFKPIKNWTDEELAEEHEICKAKMAADNAKAYEVEHE